jgi:large subunit ribosomal protein L20
MARVKGGVKARRRHNRILAITKGQFGARNHSIRRASEARLHALWYAYRDRRNRRRELRRLWIVRINAAARLNGTTYSHLTSSMKRVNIRLDRKVLSDLAVRDAAAFSVVVKTALG